MSVLRVCSRLEALKSNSSSTGILHSPHGVAVTPDGSVSLPDDSFCFRTLVTQCACVWGLSLAWDAPYSTIGSGASPSPLPPRGVWVDGGNSGSLGQDLAWTLQSCLRFLGAGFRVSAPEPGSSASCMRVCELPLSILTCFPKKTLGYSCPRWV